MSFHCCVYNTPAAGINAVNTDLALAPDTVFSQRNNHLLATEDYAIMGVALVGASLLRGRFQTPRWNAVGEFNIQSVNRALTPPSNPQLDWYEPVPPLIPTNEELSVQLTNNLGAATEIENAVLLLRTPDHSFNLPRGTFPGINSGFFFPIRATFTVTPTLNAWSGPQALTFSQTPRGGSYAIVGCQVQGANAVAFRLIFPRMRAGQRRPFRPGFIMSTAVGDVLNIQRDPWMLNMGEWGRWSTFEPVTVEVFGTAAAATTYQVFMWLVFLGDDPNLIS